MTQLYWMFVCGSIFTFAWLMMKLARFTTPISASVGILIVGIGSYTGQIQFIAYGGGLLAFSMLMLLISKNV